MIDRFIVGLMRVIGGLMFFGGMALLAYAVIGGYYHYTIWWHAVLWGFGGWILFWVGKDLLEQYKPAAQPALAPQQPMPTPLPLSPYPNAGTNTRNPFPSQNSGGWQPSAPPLDAQTLDD